jgi:lipoyl-dependent peroxiredoxin
MVVRKASAVWEGTFKDGKGTMSFGSGAYKGAYTAASRFESGTGTNPEELIGAAYAGCFSQALSLDLTKAGYPPDRISTEADVKLEPVDEGFAITEITIRTKGVVPGIDADTFQEYAEAAKEGCPVSKALKGVKKSLEAELNNA